MAKTASVPGQIDVNKLKASKKVFNPGPARSRYGNIFNFLFLCLIGCVMIIPFVYIVSNALKPMDELFLFPPRLFVQNPTFENFASIGSLLHLPLMYLKSVIFREEILFHRQSCFRLCLHRQ